MTEILLDTDACIEIIRGNPAPVDAFPAARFTISTITRFELLSGLRGKGKTRAEQRARAFLDAVETLHFDLRAADEAARIRIHLESRGSPIGAYDTLLAAHALSAGIPILTGNGKDFNRVPGLRVLSWARPEETR